MKPPTYPLRPINGGPLPSALKYAKPGRWAYEPKVNGWRTLVHAPSGAMFNRHGEPLSIAREFAPVLHVLATASKHPDLEWLDCEAFERRHPLGRGSLVLLDVPLWPGDYDERQSAAEVHLIEPVGEAWAFEQVGPPADTLLSFAYTYEEGDADMHPLPAWERLQKMNRALGCELFEGLVAKRTDSAYPLQLRSPGAEFAGWVKHRWAF